MTVDEINAILGKIAEIEAIDYHTLAVERYPDQNLNEVILSAGFSVTKTKNLLNRLITHFKVILESEDSLILPIVFTFNEYDSATGQNNVYGYFDHIVTWLNAKNFDEVSKGVRWLIAYQMNFGFWNQSDKKIHDINAIQLYEKENEIEALLAQSKAQKQKYEDWIIEIAKTKEGLDDFYRIKQEELQTITNTLEKVRTEAEQIDSYWKKASELDSEINAMRANWVTQYDDLKNQMKNQQNDYEEFVKVLVSKNTDFDNLVKEIRGKNEMFDGYLESIKGKKDFIDEKEKEIIKLTGFAADGSLGHTFNTRQNNIGKQVTLWFWAIPIMSIICLSWVFCVFYFGNGSNDYWIITLINSIKTIPAFILLYFVIRQYSKERNLQEEYAFKASVAMTLKAYSDQLGTESDIEKRKMLVDAIEKLYTSPKIAHENSGLFTFRAKSLNDTLKTLTDFTQQMLKK